MNTFAKQTDLKCNSSSVCLTADEETTEKIFFWQHVVCYRVITCVITIIRMKKWRIKEKDRKKRRTNWPALSDSPDLLPFSHQLPALCCEATSWKQRCSLYVVTVHYHAGWLNSPGSTCNILQCWLNASLAFAGGESRLFLSTVCTHPTTSDRTLLEVMSDLPCH